MENRNDSDYLFGIPNWVWIIIIVAFACFRACKDDSDKNYEIDYGYIECLKREIA